MNATVGEFESLPARQSCRFHAMERNRYGNETDSRIVLSEAQMFLTVNGKLEIAEHDLAGRIAR